MQTTLTRTRVRLALLVVLSIMAMLLMKADRAMVGASDAATIASEALKLGNIGIVSAPGSAGRSIGPYATSMNAALIPMAGCAGANFSQPATSPEGAGDGPVAIAVGDFNLDGRPDLATANGDSNNVTILLGDGTGNFTQPLTSPEATGAAPLSIAVGDFNLDGRPDLVTANNGSNDVTILLGDGTGNFTPAVASPKSVGNRPRSVAVGDFNLDGRPDLAVANFFSDNVTILLGDGTGNFTPAATSPESTGGRPRSVVVGDFNLDGRPDLATVNLTTDNLTILLGDGTGNFTQPATSPEGVGDTPISVVVGDFNLDGRPDLATANNGSNDVTILLGDGTGNFTPAATSPKSVGQWPVAVVVGDFNLDGRPDLATTNSASDNLTILLGDGTGNFNQPSNSPIAVGDAPFAIVAGDFNLDGRPDLASTNGGTDDVTILLNTCTALPCGNTNFMQPAGSPLTAGGSPYSVAVGDFNSDGRLDLALANASGGNAAILLGNGMGGFSGPTKFDVPPGPGSVAVGDFNLDGRLDLALTVPATAFQHVAILLGDGLGGFSGPTNFAVGDGPLQVAVGDFNRDGRPDLVTANNISHNVSILLGNGAGGFSPVTNFVTGLYPNGVAVGDFNLDGKLDLVTTDAGSSGVSILLGDGMGGFSNPTSFAVGGNPAKVVVGDFNADGRLDLATANGTTISVLFGTGMGGFSVPINTATSSSYRLAAGDLNADGRLDLAIVDSSSFAVLVLRGNGMGRFSAPVSFAVGTDPSWVAVGDINLDGKLDLAVTNFSSGNVTILLNTCTGGLPPTITATPVTRVAGSSSANSQIATVNDAEDAKNTLLVTLNGGSTATVNGVTVSNLTVGATGVVKADVVAACGATTANFTLKVTDSAGLMATATLTVTVTPDATPPTITCPASFQVGTTGASANVSYPNPTVNDNCAGATFTCAPASGSSFPLGVTTVTCTARDAANNPASCGFTITVNRATSSLDDPLVCTGPGSALNDTTTLTNTSGTTQTVDFSAAPAVAGQAFIIPGSCVATGQLTGVCAATNTQVTFNGQIAAGQTVTLTYRVQVADGLAPGTQVCVNFGASFNGGPVQNGTACATVNCPAVGTGLPFPAASEVSDQKAGSLLFYNLYSSSSAAPNAQNTRIALTNTHPALPIAVHLFFVDGATCSIADSLVCLTPNQTASFLASDIDPGTTGYIIAVASGTVTGCPINFNYLIGDEYVKLSSGHAANLTAESFAALAGGLPACNALSVTTVLNFDGVQLNRAPRVVAASNVPSRANGNDTLIVLNRLGGSLAAGAATLGSLFGILYDDAENPLSFTFVAGVCQFRSSLSNNFPRTAPRFEQFIPAGRSGWAKFYSLSDVGLLGAQINFNANAGTAANAFNQGHNLHKLTLTSAAQLTVPIFPPNC